MSSPKMLTSLTATMRISLPISTFMTTFAFLPIMTMNAAQAAQSASVATQEAANSNSDASGQTVDSVSIIDVQQSDKKPIYSAVSTHLFLECATLQTDRARLACYDTVVERGDTTVATPKKPLDLVQSVKSTLQGKPKAVLAETDTYERPQSEVLSKVGVSLQDIQKHTPLSRAFDLDENNERGVWTPRPYQSIYMLPAFTALDRNTKPESPNLGVYTYESGEYDPVELKAQVSLKTKVSQDLFGTNADLWVGYTQQMHWQVYNAGNSRPFRGTDYMPEMFLTQPVKAPLPFDGSLRMLGVGALHHSNGQDDPLSRSWNRLYVMGGAEWDNLTVIPKAWAHVKNKDDDESDNPDITDYYGNGEIQALYDFGGGQSLGATGRYNFGTEHGALQLDYTHPITSDVQGYIQLFHGYGESIIDYNHKSTSIGIGVKLNDWKGL